MATGLLIICTGKGTKWVDFFMAQEKAYTGTIRLGEETPSYDAETEVTERSTWQHLSDADICAAASTFVGDISQTPPMFSGASSARPACGLSRLKCGLRAAALKRDGVQLYKMARKGEVVERAQRQLHIARFHVWRDAPSSQDVHFAVVRVCPVAQSASVLRHACSSPHAAAALVQTCSKGTYVRSLAHDLGRALGTHGHLVALRREGIGEHSVADAWELRALVDLISASRAPRVAL